MNDRTRRDLCPGLLRPWIADDGALVRLRVPGGQMSAAALRSLGEIADRFGDGGVYLTRRANLQIRGLEHTDGCLPPELVEAVMATGLMPSVTHERVRNITASPLTGRHGGLVDLRPVVSELDERLCAHDSLTALAGRFLFVLDDGRGDLADRDLDLGLTAIGAGEVQLRVGSHMWGPVVDLADAAAALVDLADRFVRLAGAEPRSPWHVDELPGGPASLLDSGTEPRSAPTRVGAPLPPVGRIAQDDGRTALHLAVPDGRLDQSLLTEALAWGSQSIVVTPWRTLIVPDLEEQ